MLLSALSDEQIFKVHAATTRILKEVGVEVESSALVNRLEKAGCRVKESRVFFSPAQIDSLLRAKKEPICFEDSKKDRIISIGDNTPYFASGHQALFVMDDARRYGLINDCISFSRLSDRLGEIDMVAMPIVPNDIAPQLSLAMAARLMFENTSKPVIMASDSPDINELYLNMHDVVYNGTHHHALFELSPTSPLCWTQGPAESLMALAKRGVPIDIVPAPISGVTAPITLAGWLAVGNAEALSGVLMARLINPSAPVMYCGAWTSYEMRQFNPLIARPEGALLRMAGAQMARYYNLPCHTIAPDADSHCMDEQCAYEKMMTTLLAVLGGNDLCVNCGMFATGLTASLEQLVVDNDICKNVRRVARGFAVDEESLAFSTISNVQPKGSYIMEDHTLDHICSDEHMLTDLPFAGTYERWEADGRRSITTRAKDAAARLLSQNMEPVLDENQLKELDALYRGYAAKCRSAL